MCNRQKPIGIHLLGIFKVTISLLNHVLLNLKNLIYFQLTGMDKNTYINSSSYIC